MRQATPDLLAAQPAPADFNLVQAMTAAPLAPALRYDYAALGTAGESIRQHALAIKAAERRMGEATVEAGRHLLAVKETIPHGHWLTWLADEFGMSDDAAQVTMNVARRFGAKTESIRYLSPTVLGLLAAKSVPDEAIDAAIAASTTEAVTVRTAKAIIAAHRPASLRHAQGKCRKCGRTLTDPDAIRAGIGSCCAARLVQGAAQGEAKDAPPLPEWVTVEEPDAAVWVVTDFNNDPSAIADSTPAPTVAPPQGESAANEETHADGKLDVLARLAQRLSDLVGVMRELGQSYGEVTGDFTTPLEVKHRLERMQVRVQANMPNGGWE
ncbi:MAG: DUF3102 domain-containing protein [Caldilineaceae bacterium]|nr:DUF3102 domain-containing protein [Caldilineaceae bacterium]